MLYKNNLGQNSMQWPLKNWALKLYQNSRLHIAKFYNGLPRLTGPFMAIQDSYGLKMGQVW